MGHPCEVLTGRISVKAQIPQAGLEGPQAEALLVQLVTQHEVLVLVEQHHLRLP